MHSVGGKSVIQIFCFAKRTLAVLFGAAQLSRVTPFCCLTSFFVTLCLRKCQDLEVTQSSCALIIRAIYGGGQHAAGSWWCSSTAFEFTEPIAALKTCCSAQLRRKVGALISGDIKAILRTMYKDSWCPLQPFLCWERHAGFLGVAIRYLWNYLTCLFPYVSYGSLQEFFSYVKLK